MLVGFATGTTTLILVVFGGGVWYFVRRRRRRGGQTLRVNVNSSSTHDPFAEQATGECTSVPWTPETDKKFYVGLVVLHLRDRLMFALGRCPCSRIPRTLRRIPISAFSFQILPKLGKPVLRRKRRTQLLPPQVHALALPATTRVSPNFDTFSPYHPFFFLLESITVRLGI